jgi:hypothetical protein
VFSLFSLVAVILMVFNTSVSWSVYEKSVIISVPVLALAIAAGIAGYFHIGYWYAPLLPLGWLFQPLFFFQSLRGKYRHYYKWKGRKVYHS